MGNLCSISIATEDTVSHCWDCTAGQAKYICMLEENLIALKDALDELRKLRNDVMTRVNVDEQQQQLKRLDQVQGWFSRVEATIVESDKLITDGPQEIQKLCLGICCSRSPLSSYKFGKKVVQKLQQVVALKSKGAFEKVAERVPAALVDERPCEATVGLESIFSNVWNSFSRKDVGIIGIYGMGSVGKTTLLNHVNNKFINTPRDYDVVIWVVVSKDLNLEKVQEDIGKRIGFSDGLWKCKRLDEKAADIYRALSRKKFVLLLDDIWKRVNLSEVGVPLPNEENESKIVFTTRSEEVCCHMEAKKIFKVECLAWGSAWDLFQKKVGKALHNHPDIPRLARIVAKQCCGLPLALITIGRAMACKKTPQEWHHAIQVLRKSASEFSGIGDDVFPLLKFSYDNLPNHKVKSCFLYCSLFPHNFRIHKTNLIDYWIGEGFLVENDDVNGMQNLGYDVIGTLVYACLLEDKGDYVVMHDVIRDMALWIACEFGKMKDNFLSLAGTQLAEAPEIRKWEGVERMSLMANNIESLTEAPTCPNLRTLFLSHNFLKTVIHGFFQFMPNLIALDLSGNKNLTELPIGISELSSLQYLNLSMTGIRQLPIELQALVKLRYLNLDNTSALVKVPQGVISSFSLLQVLKMVNSGFMSRRSESFIEELQCLQHLVVLCITITRVTALDRFLSIHKFRSCTQDLSLQLFSGSKLLNILSLKQIKQLNVLRMSNCKSLEEVKIDIQASQNLRNSEIINKKFFNSLHRVYVDNCSKLKDLTWVILAPNLTVLRVSLCFEIEEILSTEKVSQVSELNGDLIPFGRLQILYLSHLRELKSIHGNALPFPYLKRIFVCNCPKLKKLPLNSNSAKGHKIIIEGNDDWWKELQLEDEATKIAFQPCFKSNDF